MSASAGPEEETAWSFAAEAPIERVAVAARAGFTVASDRDRNIYVLDPDGRVVGKFRAGQPVRRVGADREGELFAALAGDGIVYAFDRTAGLQWRVEFDRHLEDFHLGPAGEYLVAAAADGQLCVYSSETRAKMAGRTQWAPRSVVAFAADPLQFAVAGADGDLAAFGPEGNCLWTRNLRGRIGPIACEVHRPLLAVPALEDGLRLFQADGAEAGTVKLDQPARRVAVRAGADRFLVETTGPQFVLTERAGLICWKKSLRRPPADWAADARLELLAVVDGEGALSACRVEEWEPRPGKTGQGPDADAPRETLRMSSQPGVKAPEVLWQTDLAADAEGVDVSRLAVGREGNCTVLVFADGTVIGLDRSGESVVQTRTSMPAWTAPAGPAAGVAVWSASGVLMVEPGKRQTRSVSFKDEADFFDCSRDLRFAVRANAAGALACLGANGETVWSRQVDPAPVDVYVSPSGGVVMTGDESGRYRFFTDEGRLFHKLRFGGAATYPAAGLSDEFALFASPGGRMYAVDHEGRKMWGGRPVGALDRTEVPGETVYAYSLTEDCAVVEPLSGDVWELVPPPGRTRLRKPPEGDPVLLHAEGNVLTAFTGYRRKLDVLWRYRAEAGIDGFGVCAEGHVAVLTVGPEVTAVRCTNSH